MGRFMGKDLAEVWAKQLHLDLELGACLSTEVHEIAEVFSRCRRAVGALGSVHS